MTRTLLRTPGPRWNLGNVARNKSQAEYPELFPDFAWSPCFGNTGLTLYDAGGQGRNGTLTNMDPATDWVLSEGRWALEFAAGSSQYVSLGQVPGIVGLTQCTLSAWLYRTVATNSVSVGRYIANSRFAMTWFTDGAIYFLVDSGATFSFESFAGSLTGWHHFSLVYDGSLGVEDRIRGYMDGSLLATTRDPSFPPPTSIPAYGADEFRIGVINSTVYSTGLVDDVLLHKSALTTDQERQLYSLGRGGWAERRARRVVGVGAASGGPRSVFESPIFKSPIFQGAT